MLHQFLFLQNQTGYGAKSVSNTSAEQVGFDLRMFFFINFTSILPIHYLPYVL
ncbi:hypothetical protein OIU77_006243 [Salix suchowensis]|uniref:Uncharacterized protein n=1 Tax=Salix suchowensis TaxID=1278906 RepID=A0ABQ9AK48_9ROSI|nr:hypothetical protein OIU77_006243 [Salix suchowensis]